MLEEALAEVAQDPWRFEAPALVLTPTLTRLRVVPTLTREVLLDPHCSLGAQRLGQLPQRGVQVLGHALGIERDIYRHRAAEGSACVRARG